MPRARACPADSLKQDLERMKKILFLPFILILCTAAAAMAQGVDVVVVDKLEANLFSAPGSGMYDIKLNQGVITRFLDQKKGWYYVQLRNGQKGWLAGWSASAGKYHYAIPALPDLKALAPSPDKPEYAGVFSESALLRTEPTNMLPAASDHTRIGMLEQGTVLKIVGHDGHWCKVALAQGKTGWIYDEMLDFSVPPPPGLWRIQGISYQPSFDADILTVSLPGKAPAVALSLDNGVKLSIFNAQIAEEIISNLHLPPNVAVENPATGLVVITLTLPHPPMGHATAYVTNELSHENQLTLRIKKPAAAGASSLPLSGYTIVVDPGHGAATNYVGYRGGAPGPEGLQEHELNLVVALKLKPQLESLGARVFLTREGLSDEMASLYARTDFAQKLDADIFVSIHCNGSENRKARGLELYWFDPQSRHLAQALAEVMPLHMNTGPGKPIYASFGVIRQTEMPAVLVELGYLSNPEEGRLFLDDAFLDRCALGIRDGLARYVQIFAGYATQSAPQGTF